ncbi:MAG: SgcJ/EcaC family oxidoreductase, partial [Planctomycetota bacterium]
MCWRQFLAAGMLGGTLIAMPWAGSASEPDDAELKAIRAAATDYISALERGDAEAVAEAWTDDGDYVDAVGRTFKAREIIASQFAGGGKARPLQVTVDQVRLISPAVAIEDGCVVHGGPSGDAALCSRYSAVWVKKDDGWRLDSLRESLPPAPPRNPQLSELAWLLGEFTGLADDDSQIIVSATISRDGNYILREISVTHPSEGSRS